LTIADRPLILWNFDFPIVLGHSSSSNGEIVQDEGVVLPVDFEEAVTMDEDELSDDEDEDVDEDHDEVCFIILTFTWFHIFVSDINCCSLQNYLQT
jgi:hypothetical protein